MKTVNILLFLLFLVFSAESQPRVPLAFEEFERGFNVVDEIELFNLAEIKSRKIRTAYIIEHSCSWWEEWQTIGLSKSCIYSDTLEIFNFDSQGRIIKHTNIDKVYSHYWQVETYDTVGKILTDTLFSDRNERVDTTIRLQTRLDTTESKTIVKSAIKGQDSLVSEIWLSNRGQGLDTFATISKTFSRQGKLLDIQGVKNPKWRLLEHNDDFNYHYIYDYDEKGRLIYYRKNKHTYTRISYPFYGKLTETYDLATDTVVERQVKLITNSRYDNGMITVTLEGKQIILEPLEPGSKLFIRKTQVISTEFPVMNRYEIVYK